MAAPTGTTVDQTDRIPDPAAGHWTEERFLGLPTDRRRVELLDGALLVSPNPARPHQRLSFRLCALLDGARPDDVEVLEAVNVRLGPERILIPDLAVVTLVDSDGVTCEASETRLVVEILGPNRRRTGEAVKPALYAAAGIPHYLRIDLGPDGPEATAYALSDGRYRETVRARPGERLCLTEPIVLDVGLAALLAAGRLPG
ncbi:MAG: Uma2 family endonuclease [Pseudonocardia sp.]|nr:Uma2 family endonuclease [Pseudonocardia sp.]